MDKTFILLLMIFLHIIDDFNLQGIMASMKQKEWWKSHPEYTKLYKFDWLPVPSVAECKTKDDCDALINSLKNVL